jgi:hypothetical protein
MKNTIFILLILTFSCSRQGEGEKIQYHSYEGSASISRISEWNILNHKNEDFKVKEEFDAQNRVVSIQFLANGEVKGQNSMYGITNIEFQYGDNYIIEKYLNPDGSSMSLLEDEAPSSRKYIINDNNEIINCETRYSIQFNELSKDKLLEIEDGLKLWRENALGEEDETSTDECEMDYIYGYIYSNIKMNGIWPKKSNFNFDKNLYEMWYSEELINKMEN